MQDNTDILFYVAIWLFLAMIPAYIAGTKNRSIIGFFLLSLFFSPVVAIIAVLVGGPATSKATELEHLADLKTKGALSDEEFQKAKAKILA